MRRINRWYLILAGSLLLSSVILYLLHYAVFRDAHHIFIFLLEDIAFIPIHVLIITLIIDKLLSYREKREVFKRLNMVVGSFFSEFGNDLLKILTSFDRNFSLIAPQLLVNGSWTDDRFFSARKNIEREDFAIDSCNGDLSELKKTFTGQRDFLLRLLENPSVTEFESFTNMLLAVFHLSDELYHRNNFDNVPEEDYEHLTNDIKRVYGRLIFEWLRHMNHLKRDYPYLFSMAVRTNPFDSNSSVVFSEENN